MEIQLLFSTKHHTKQANIGITPLHHAAQNGHLAVARLIIETIVSDKNPGDNIPEKTVSYFCFFVIALILGT